jgi:hypothetical protein
MLKEVRVTGVLILDRRLGRFVLGVSMLSGSSWTEALARWGRRLSLLLSQSWSCHERTLNAVIRLIPIPPTS